MENKSAYFKQGFSDYLRGITEVPYSPTSARGEEWSMGWYEAQSNDPDAFPELEDGVDEESINDYSIRRQIAQDNIEE